MARRKIVAGNWKMNMTPSQAVELCNTLKDLVKSDDVDVVYCVPAIDSGYDDFCVEYADYRRMNVEDLYEVLEELQNSAKGFDTYNDWFEHIEHYTAELEKIYRQQNQNPESVALATLHSSKGLEYDNVYIIDVNEGIMPYKKAVLDNEVEEERRMFYVGMTRAKKKLHLYSIEQLNHKNADISRFIRESQKK